MILTRFQIGWIGIFSISVLLLSWVVFGDIFSIKKVTCTRDDSNCDEQIIAEMERLLGFSLLRFSPVSLESKLQSADPTIGEISIEAVFPDRLNATIVSKQVSFAIRDPQSSEVYLVDDQLKIYSRANAENISVPEIIITELGEYSIGENLNDNNVSQAIELSKTLSSQFVPFATMNVDGEVVTVMLKNDAKGIFTLRRDLLKQVTSLQQILSQATIESKPITIDVRYDKPVVKGE